MANFKNDSHVCLYDVHASSSWFALDEPKIFFADEVQNEDVLQAFVSN